MSSESISLKFKTLKNSGILLHAEGQNGHSLTLELEKGKLELLIRKGTNLRFLFMQCGNCAAVYIEQTKRTNKHFVGELLVAIK